MAATLPSVVGHKNKKPQEEAVSGKDDILNKKMNERMKRKAMIQAQFNKFQKDIQTQGKRIESLINLCEINAKSIFKLCEEIKKYNPNYFEG